MTASLTGDDFAVLDELDDETLQRRRGRTRKGRPTGRYQMVVHVDDQGVIQMAVLEGRVLVEHYVSRSQDDATSIDGNIYLGKVQNVLPGMEAAFIDIGTPKNGVLYRGDVQFDESEVDEAQPKIERLLKNGQAVLVQVTKNPIGAKGARLTQEVSLAGRFVVMVPNQPATYGISKRLPDDERKRLRKVLEGIRPANAGLIVRTAAEGATPDELARDLARLQDQWQQISDLGDRSKPAKLLYQEPPLVVRVIREEFTKEYRSIVIDDPAMYEDVKSYVEAIAPSWPSGSSCTTTPTCRCSSASTCTSSCTRRSTARCGSSRGARSSSSAPRRSPWSTSTPARTSGSPTSRRRYLNNLEAANEIARQLRLRDIGGIIVIDFIDMEIERMYPGTEVTQNENVQVPGWKKTSGSPSPRDFYRDVVAPSCRTCHYSQDSTQGRSPSPTPTDWDQVSELATFAGSAAAFVCQLQQMPHALITHRRFWLSDHPKQKRLVRLFALAHGVPRAAVKNCR